MGCSCIFYRILYDVTVSDVCNNVIACTKMDSDDVRIGLVRGNQVFGESALCCMGYYINKYLFYFLYLICVYIYTYNKNNKYDRRNNNIIIIGAHRTQHV